MLSLPQSPWHPPPEADSHLQVLDMGTRFAQGIHQVADGALFHARLAAQGTPPEPRHRRRTGGAWQCRHCRGTG